MPPIRNNLADIHWYLNRTWAEKVDNRIARSRPKCDLEGVGKPATIGEWPHF